MFRTKGFDIQSFSFGNGTKFLVFGNWELGIGNWGWLIAHWSFGVGCMEIKINL